MNISNVSKISTQVLLGSTVIFTGFFGISDLSVSAYTYPGTKNVAKAGDVLYTDKSSTRYFTGHVAIVDSTGKYVVHAKGSSYGLERESLKSFNSDYKFDAYRAKSSTVGSKAGSKALALQKKYSKAKYTVWTTLSGPYSKQYCTKFVWQAYYDGAGVNLGDLSYTKLTVPPTWILDGDFLKKVANDI